MKNKVGRLLSAMPIMMILALYGTSFVLAAEKAETKENKNKKSWFALAGDKSEEKSDQKAVAGKQSVGGGGGKTETKFAIPRRAANESRAAIQTNPNASVKASQITKLEKNPALNKASSVPKAPVTNVRAPAGPARPLTVTGLGSVNPNASRQANPNASRPVNPNSARETNPNALR